MNIKLAMLAVSILVALPTGAIAVVGPCPGEQKACSSGTYSWDVSVGPTVTMEQQCFIKVSFSVTKWVNGEVACQGSATQLVPCSATSTNPQILCDATFVVETTGSDGSPAPTFEQVTQCSDLDLSGVTCP